MPAYNDTGLPTDAYEQAGGVPQAMAQAAPAVFQGWSFDTSKDAWKRRDISGLVGKPRDQWTSQDYFNAGQVSDGSQVYWDEQGKPYFQRFDAVGGGRDYAQPTDSRVTSLAATDPRVAAFVSGNQRPEDGGFFRTNQEWNAQTGNWDDSFNWANTVPLIAAGVTGAGAAGLIPGVAGIGAAGAGGGGAAAAGLVPEVSGGITPAMAGTIGAGAVGPAVGGIGGDVAGVDQAIGAMGGSGAGGLQLGPQAANAVNGLAGKTSGASGLAGILGSLLQGDTLSNLGQVAGSSAAGMAEQRNNEAQARVRADELQRRSRVLASLLGGLGDAQATGGNPNITSRTPQISGGLRPSAFGDVGGGKRAALIQMLNQPVDLPKAGALENTLGGVGLAGSLLGALRK